MTPGAAGRGTAEHFDPKLLEGLGVPVRRLALDSRRLHPGDVFLAYAGEARDGREFIPQAIAAGAAAVLWESRGFRWDPAWKVPNLPVPGLRAAAGAIASHVYGHPSEKLWLIGATGTNGKTSITHWIAQAMNALGRKTALIGTLGLGFPGELRASGTTTPDPVALQESLAEFVARGASCVAMEVSSHALEQGRVNGVRFACALFTNLSRDHLDYHGSMDRYAAAKARLFRWPRLTHAVLNLDDAFGRELAQQLRGAGPEVVGYGFSPEALKLAGGEGFALVRGEDLSLDAQGIRFRVDSPWGEARVQSPMLGRFNGENLLAALAALLVSSVELEPAVQAIEAVGPVPGRLEQLGGGAQPLVVVDYAHTPDALEKVLLTLREALCGSEFRVSSSGLDSSHAKPETRIAKLICVFGCGGERDRGKRPLMGEVVSRLADLAYVTSDNPRGEGPRRIIEEITAGMGANHRVVEDRASAIYEALAFAAPGDVVLIAGKGHETYQEIQGRRLPFSDVEAARTALAHLAEEGRA